MTPLNAVRLRVFHELFTSIAEECGELLRQTAPSPNIRERRDYSCAIFDASGALVAQAAHIPVHLGSAALSIEAVRTRFDDLATGDAILLNDPYAGGTHLPDLTLIHAVGEPGAAWYVLTRAHHADIGGSEPGSMAPAHDLPAEGLRIPPVHESRRGVPVPEVEALLLANTRTPEQRRGDLRAQRQAGALGVERILAMMDHHGVDTIAAAAVALREYTTRLFRASLASLENGTFAIRDALEGDGIDDEPIGLALEFTRTKQGRLVFDFQQSDDQCRGGLNANPAIVLAAVLYALACVAGDELPINGGLLTDVEVRTRKGTVLDPEFPAAVAGGNVETSQRLVDMCLAALGRAGADVPASSQGTMNNLTLGGTGLHGEAFAFYETLAGGSGASRTGVGASCVQSHMTNTRNTPIEDCELSQPLVIERLHVRRRSGGRGHHRGGDGLVKELRALVPLRGALLSERRVQGPPGRNGGQPGKPGRQWIVDAHGVRRKVSAKGRFSLAAGDRLILETPGGGGFGAT
ncbi:MAG: hydantoinase B/oxoprolinase family protein [Planctomycetes bacterium]|nr:hydantoinase B/oxoprolinase family protein [Planctomycetota bacterium]